VLIVVTLAVVLGLFLAAVPEGDQLLDDPRLDVRGVGRGGRLGTKKCGAQEGKRRQRQRDGEADELDAGPP